MRILFAIVAGLWLSLIPVWAESLPGGSAPVSRSQSADESAKSCGGKSAGECNVSRDELKRARKAFNRGLKLEDGHPGEALTTFDLAVRLAPQNIEYATARAMILQQLVNDHLQRGNQLMARRETVLAAAEFGKALELDPSNQYVSERLLDATHDPLPGPLTYTASAPEALGTSLRPKLEQQTLHFRADARSAYSSIGTAFSIKVTFDESAPRRSVHLDLEKVSFEQAMDAVALITRSFWTPLSPGEVKVAADSPGKRKDLERWVLQTIVLPETSSPEQLNEMAGLLKSMFDLSSVYQSPANRTITVRGPGPQVAVATRFLHTLWAEQPQVMLDIEVYQVNRQMLRDMGIALPSQFTMFILPHSAFLGLGNSAIQLLVSKALASGGASAASVAAIPALISQLQQGSSLAPQLVSSTFSVGGASTTVGLNVPPATANFSKNHSEVNSLTKVALRASQGSAAIFRLGTRYPIITASYTSGATSLGTVPSIAYVDLGVTIHATPTIHKDDVTLALDMEMSSVGSQLYNGVPTISNRNYSGTITVRNNEPAVVTGSMSRTEIKSMQGLPAISKLPVLGALTSDHSTEEDEDELLVMITPHVTSAAPVRDSSELFLPR